MDCGRKKLPRLSGAQTMEAADTKASRRMTNAVSGKQRLLFNGYEGKSAESMNLRKLHLGKAICPAPEGGLQPVRGFLASAQLCRSCSCCRRRRRAAFVRCRRDGRGRRSRQSIAVCPVARQNSAVPGDSATGSAKPAARHTSSMRQRTALASRGKLSRGWPQ
jgi:hypothetical protein